MTGSSCTSELHTEIGRASEAVVRVGGDPTARQALPALVVAEGDELGLEVMEHGGDSSRHRPTRPGVDDIVLMSS
jgi:hypothetical protein